MYVSVNLSNQAICKLSDNCRPFCKNACFNRSINKLSENFSQFVNRLNLLIFFFHKLTNGETDNL